MTYLIQLLAVARLTRLVTEDSITEPMRDYALATNTKIGELVHCRACTSVWAALVVVLLGRKAPKLVQMLALSEGVILFREKLDQ